MKWIRLKNNWRNDRDSLRSTIAPERDWLRLLLAWFVAVAILFAAVAVWFWRIRDLAVGGSRFPASSTSLQLNERDLDRTLERTRRRAADFAAAQAAAPALVDPSR